MNGAPQRLLGWPLWAWQVLMVLVCLGAVSMAWVSQHHHDMQPCPWCILQRVVFLGIAAVMVIAAVWRQAWAQAVAHVAAAGLALFGLGLAVWQNQVAAHSQSCKLTFADHVLNAMGLPEFWPNMFEPRASCADAAVTWAGLPYEAWSGGLFAMMAALLITLLYRQFKG